MSDRLKDKVAIITGATSGIGEATAEVFAREGAMVVVSGRSEERGRRVVERLDEPAEFVRCDVTEEEQIKHLVETTVQRFGRVDILFNNAGGALQSDLLNVSAETIDHMTRLLFSSVVLGIKYVAPTMIAQKSGSIINNASVAAQRVRNGSALYSSLKAAVTHYTRIAGHELGPHGIRVNSISPGAIATPIFWGGSARADTLPEAENERKMEKLKGNLARSVPMQKYGTGYEIAHAALYLAGDEGRFVTCHDLVVDGGRVHLSMEPPSDGSGWQGRQ